jgi:RNase P subunit RPR2
MVQCEQCKRVLFVTSESKEFSVRGEMSILIYCPECKEMKEVPLFQYGEGKRKVL